MKKISKLCRCAPWFVPRNLRSKNVSENNEEDSINDLPICNLDGSKCFEEKSKAYKHELVDRKECDCKNDCEMVHIFSTLQVTNLDR